MKKLISLLLAVLTLLTMVSCAPKSEALFEIDPEDVRDIFADVLGMRLTCEGDDEIAEVIGYINDFRYDSKKELPLTENYPYSPYTMEIMKKDGGHEFFYFDSGYVSYTAREEYAAGKIMEYYCGDDSSIEKLIDHLPKMKDTGLCVYTAYFDDLESYAESIKSDDPELQKNGVEVYDVDLGIPNSRLYKVHGGMSGLEYTFWIDDDETSSSPLSEKAKRYRSEALVVCGAKGIGRRIFEAEKRFYAPDILPYEEYKDMFYSDILDDDGSVIAKKIYWLDGEDCNFTATVHVKYEKQVIEKIFSTDAPLLTKRIIK